MDISVRQSNSTVSRERMPRPVRAALIAFVALLLAGALYLISVRGEALLLDLSALSQRMFCF